MKCGVKDIKLVTCRWTFTFLKFELVGRCMAGYNSFFISLDSVFIKGMGILWSFFFYVHLELIIFKQALSGSVLKL